MEQQAGDGQSLLSGSILTVTADLSQRYGWDYFKALKANGMKIEGGNTAVQNKLVTGEYFVGIIGEENILKVSAKGEPLKVAYPTDGAVILPSPIAIFASSQNPEAAKAVTDWWLSKKKASRRLSRKDGCIRSATMCRHPRVRLTKL